MRRVFLNVTLAIAALYTLGVGNVYAQGVRDPGKGTISRVPVSNMSLPTTGVDSFLLAHPNADGRGVLVLIFDTGVDMSIPGLLKTSTGETKVVDAIDFSSSCVVKFRPAKINAGTATADGLKNVLRNVSALGDGPKDSVWYMGSISEATYKSAAVRDFDGDGKSESNFGVLLWNSPKGWRVAIDTDDDSSMTGETAVGTYRITHDYVIFQQRDTSSKPPLTFAATIDPNAKTVSFHYDMGGHGTHVAGIATGHDIQGTSGFDGVAPGAQVISCKFSADTAKDNTVTGTMKRAYEYAAHLADSLAKFHQPVVVNMSFGIGSALENRSVMERYIDSIIPLHPNLYIVVAAGNEGPGLSSIGLPAASPSLISVGALLPKEVAHDGFNMSLTRDVLWDFSSRGGEVDKPDIVAPGTAVSTIPRFAFQARESGTSMASPHVAGLVTLLLSAVRNEDSAWMPTQEIIKRALRASAVNMSEYPTVEQGEGIANVNRAYQQLMKWRVSGMANDVARYEISAPSTYYPDGKGTTYFLRQDNVAIPDTVVFTVTAQSQGKPGAGVGAFTQKCDLTSTAPWLKPANSTATVHSGMPTTVPVVFDKKLMAKPGIYSARILATRSGTPAYDNQREFSLLNTVIVPYTFSNKNNFKIMAPAQRMQPGGISRYFFSVPTGAVGIAFTLSVPKKSVTSVGGQVLNKEGYTGGYLSRASGAEKPTATNIVAVSECGTGIIEAVVQSDASEEAISPVDVTLSAECIMADVAVTTAPETDTSLSLTVKVANSGTKALSGTMKYVMKGYERTVDAVMHGDTFSMPFVVRKGDGAVWITPKFSQEQYMRSTDILARVIDSNGAVQAAEAFNKPSEMLFLPNFARRVDSTKYTLQIIFGSADYGRLDPIPVSILERHVRPNEAKVVGTISKSSPVKPGTPTTLRTSVPLSQMNAPAGYRAIGTITFEPSGSSQSVPIDFVVGASR